MKFYLRIKNLAFILLLVLPCLVKAQMPKIPVDKDVIIGKLPNGLTYYLRHNEWPKNRANFYIAQKVGSILEEENQRGLAHFLEHMCFNGTEHFKGNGIISYCESIGVKFGENLNAYTSIDETVYNINDVPTNKSQTVDSCLIILHDWADALLLDPAEIDKERSVIHEEWRQGNSAIQRILTRQLPNIYPNSKYAHRMPIGLMEVVDFFKPQVLRDYYEKWYRPDQQGIIVVGDIDVKKVEAQIKSIFGSIKMPKNPAERIYEKVPDNEAPIIVVDKDKEQEFPMITFMQKHDVMPKEAKDNLPYLMQKYIISMNMSMLNNRLNDLAAQSDCPYLQTNITDGDFLFAKTKGALSLTIIPKQDKSLEALQTAYSELLRASKFGFTTTEYERIKETFLNSLETAYKERDKKYNNYYCNQYVRHFIDNEPIPSIEDEYSIVKSMLNQIPLDVCNKMMAHLAPITDKNLVLMAFYTDKEGTKIPQKEEFLQTIHATRNLKLEPYKEEVNNDPFIDQLPAKGKILKEEESKFGYTCWTLSNGARVFYRKTDFSNTEIDFSAVSFGGLSNIADKDIINARLADLVMSNTGLGKFTNVEMRKKMSGKQVSLSSSIDNYSESLSGSSIEKDLRTLFELIYMKFTTSTNDVDGYNQAINIMRMNLENSDKNPQKAWVDSTKTTLYGHNPLLKPIKIKDLDLVNYETIKNIYKERFNTASDFDFIFTGNINVDSLRAYTEQYIASLPMIKKREDYNEDKMPKYPSKSISNRFYKKMETPKGFILRSWIGKMKFNGQNATTINALGDILNKRFLNSIREEKGYVYSIQALSTLSLTQKGEYNIFAVCPMKPEKCDSILDIMSQELKDIAENGVSNTEINKIKEYENKVYNDNLRKNSFWENAIQNYILFDYDFTTDHQNYIENIDSKLIQKMAKKLFKKNRQIDVIMLPQELQGKMN